MIRGLAVFRYIGKKPFDGPPHLGVIHVCAFCVLFNAKKVQLQFRFFLFLLSLFYFLYYAEFLNLIKRNFPLAVGLFFLHFFFFSFLNVARGFSVFCEFFCEMERLFAYFLDSFITV